MTRKEKKHTSQQTLHFYRDRTQNFTEHIDDTISFVALTFPVVTTSGGKTCKAQHFLNTIFNCVFTECLLQYKTTPSPLLTVAYGNPPPPPPPTPAIFTVQKKKGICGQFGLSSKHQFLIKMKLETISQADIRKILLSVFEQHIYQNAVTKNAWSIIIDFLLLTYSVVSVGGQTKLKRHWIIMLNNTN